MEGSYRPYVREIHTEALIWYERQREYLNMKSLFTIHHWFINPHLTNCSVGYHLSLKFGYIYVFALQKKACQNGLQYILYSICYGSQSHMISWYQSGSDYFTHQHKYSYIPTRKSNLKKMLFVIWELLSGMVFQNFVLTRISRRLFL